MADKTIDELDAIGALADVVEATEFESQVVGGSSPESRKLTTPQLRFVMLDLAELTAELAAADTDPTASYMLIQDPVLADPTTRNVRKMLVSEVAKLLAARSISKSFQTPARAGTTAGWVIPANNLGKMATLPASQAGATLVVPIDGLKIGDTITAFHLNGSIQSAGNVATITADLRLLTAAAAGAVDSSIGTMAAPLSVTANTVVSSANAVKAGLAHVVAEGESFYVLITATTAATTTEELQSIVLVITGS